MKDLFQLKISDQKNFKLFFNKENLFFLFLFPIISFYRFDLLSFYLIMILLINLLFNFTFQPFQKIIIKIYIVLIFIKRYLFDIKNEKFLNSLNNDIFWDTQLFFLQLKCNFNENFSYRFQLSQNLIDCLEGGVGYDGAVNIGFGPLSKILEFSSDIWISTIIISVLVSLVILTYFLKIDLDDKNLFMFLLLICPSFIFLFDTMNLDIIIFITILFFLKYSNNLKIIFLLLLTFFSMLKLYPIAFIAGLFIFDLFNKNIREQIISGLFLLSNLIYIIYNYIYADFSLTEKPYAPVRTYGLLSDYEAIRKFYSFEYLNLFHFLSFGIISFFFIGIVVINRKTLFKKNVINFDDEKMFLVFFPAALMISLFANYSYKLIFIYPIATIFHKILNNSEKVIFYIFFFTNPLIQIFGVSGSQSDIEFIFFIVNRFCGYYIIFLILKNASIIFTEKIFKNKLPNLHTSRDEDMQ